MIGQIFSVFLLVFGFGFVIFFHELGHFLAAKWVGIRVEQFAVGFGQALVSWRKGMGFQWGSSGSKYEQILKNEQEGINKIDPQAIGETEYRLNWIPLGGYVKMLGQDDLRPNAKADDPRAYNRKSIGARMLVVSAGVIMNILLAAIGFMVVFLMGFDAPPAFVGNVIPGSPASKANVQIGDEVVYLDGKRQHDFTKISLNTALLEAGKPAPMVVRRVDGTEETIDISAAREGDDPNGFLMIGLEPSHVLKGMAAGAVDEKLFSPELLSKDALSIRPGDVITHINGEKIEEVKGKDGEDTTQYYKLDRALQAGEPVKLTVVDSKGQERQVEVMPKLQRMFGKDPLNLAGLIPRPAIGSLDPESPARGRLFPGDIVEAISFTASRDRTSHPTWEKFTEIVGDAGQRGIKIDLQVIRDGKLESINDLDPSMKIAQGRYGLGVGQAFDGANPVVAGVIGPAAEAGIRPGSRIKSIDGMPVQNWIDIKRILSGVVAGRAILIAGLTPEGTEFTTELRSGLNEAQLDLVKKYRFDHALLLHPFIRPRQTSNPFIAAAWGAEETRDFVLQFYLTIKRMVQGSVSYKNMMGPVGIFHAGTTFANKGTDWLIWFLAMISANLAVVNFLPIPIVDGGLFTFLILEKIMGKPLSPRAQSIAQVVGLAVILSVFLLVTYQDISRFF